MVTTINNKKILMIHTFKKEYLEYKLDDYIITFDDGLYSQYQGSLDLIKKFPNIKIIIFISTGIIHTGENQTNNNSGIAHNLFFAHGITQDFLTLEQISELSKIPNITIGLHGHNHLNINWIRAQNSLKDSVIKWKDDFLNMFQVLEEWKLKNIINNDIYYCTPYNIYHPLFHPMMITYFKKQYTQDLIVLGSGRTTIEELTQGKYREQYY